MHHIQTFIEKNEEKKKKKTRLNAMTQAQMATHDRHYFRLGVSIPNLLSNEIPLHFWSGQATPVKTLRGQWPPCPPGSDALAIYYPEDGHNMAISLSVLREVFNNAYILSLDVAIKMNSPSDYIIYCKYLYPPTGYSNIYIACRHHILD